MAGIHFDITGDNSNFLRRLHEVENGVKDTSKQIEQSGLGIEELFGRMTRAAAAFGAGFTAKELISNIVQVRGEFQQLEVAFKTMLGSEDKAAALMQQLVKTAATTPFDLQGVANGAKQLLAYGEDVEKVNDDLTRLGNIAAGLSQPLGDIVYLYGTTMTQGRLYTQDLNQFTGRGIPMIRELAKVFGVAENEVKGLVEAGKVGFPEVQKVIMSLTDEGGMFFNLMQEQSKTITGQISNIEDSISTMLNEIGKANESPINDALSGVSYLVENYEKVGRSLLEIVGTYGAYKAALITITALQKVYSAVLVQSALNQRLAAASGITLSNAQALAATRAKLLQAAQEALNKTMLANPYVVAAAAIAALGLGIYKLATYQTESEKAQKKLNEAIAASDALALSEQSTLARLKGELSSLTEGTDRYNEVKDKIVKQFGKYYDGLDEEIAKVGLTEDAYNKLTEAINKSFGARQYEKFASQQQEELSNIMSENLEKIQERLYDKLGDEAGSRIYSKIREGIINGSIDTIGGTLNFSGLDRDTSKALDKVAGKEGGLFDITNRSVERYIYNILKAQKVTDEWNKKARERFGVGDDDNLPSQNESAKKNIETTYQQDLAKAKADWERAKKGYEAIIKDQKSTSKQVKEAKDDMETAEKRYKDLGGVTGSSLIKQENQAKKELEEKIKQQEQLAEQLLSLRRKNQQDEINLMEDGTERKLKQIDLDYQKELDAIKKQKAEWEKTQGGKLTEEQTSLLGERASNNAKAREKAISAVNKEELEANKKAWQEYYIEFGNYQEKRKNLVQKYNDELAKLQKDSPEYAIKEAEKSKAIEQLDEQYGKSTKAMADLFEDASDKSVNAIQAIIDKYELLVSYLSGGNGVTVEDLKAVGFTDKDLKSIEDGTINIKDVTDSIKNLKGTLAGKSPFKKFSEDIKEGIGNLKNAKGDTDAIGRGISKIGNAVVEFSGPLKEFSSNIGNIFGFDDSKIQGSIDAVSGLGQTAAGVGQIMSGDIVGGAMSAVSGISSVVSALDGMFGADYSRYNDMVEEYTRLNEIWDELIDKKQEYIDISYGVEADKVGEEALSLVEKQVEAYRLLGKERLNSGASVGSHSIGKRMVKNTSSSDWQDIANALDMSVNAAKEFIGTGRMTGLFDLTAEQLEKLKSEAPAFWAKMDGDVQEYLNGIIEGEERIEDIQNQVKEQLTQTTFDSVFDSFVDTLMDMDSSAKDFAEDFSEYMQRAILTNMVGEKFSKELQDWYDSFAEAGKDEEGITKGDMEELRKQYEEIVDAAVAERNKLAEIFGWTGEATQQSASSRGSQTMSQDTGEEFNGRLTALQIAGEEIKTQMINAVVGLNSLVSISTSGNATLSSILEQHVKTNGYLEDIVKYTKPILDFGNKFDRMITILNNGL